MNETWQAAWDHFASALTQAFGTQLIHPKVAAAIAAGGNKQRWLIACSGGADSVACAGWMTRLAETQGHALALAHYNHRWRGEEASGDAAFVRELAASFGVQCFSGEAAQVPDKRGETDARRQRLAFLRSCALTFNAGAIVFGHQLDDVAESLVLRLGRGAGSEGLAAPRPVHSFKTQPDHWRPWLHIPAATLRACLQKAAINWREDGSNLDTTHPRNALRQNILPQLEILEDRAYRTGAARTRMLLEEDAEVLDQLARACLPALFADTPVERWQVPGGISRGLLRRGLNAWLSRLQPNHWPPAAQIDAALDTLLAGANTTCLLQTETFSIALRDGSVRCMKKPTAQTEPPASAHTLCPDSSVEWLPGRRLCCTLCLLDSKQRSAIESGRIDPAGEAWLDADSVRLALRGALLQLEVRARRAGDRYQALGAPGHRKLAKILIDAGIPHAERILLPVVTTKGDTLLWVPGLPPTHRFRIHSTTKQALRLTYHSTAANSH